MDREGPRFTFLQEIFPRITMEKLKDYLFYSPQIRELMKDLMFEETLWKAELSAKKSLKTVVTNFLGKRTKCWIRNCLHELQERMSIKLLFLRSHSGYFTKNCEDLIYN